MLKSNKRNVSFYFKLTKRTKPRWWILPLLLGALGSLAAKVLGGLLAKGLQVDAQQRPYSRVPRGKGLQVDAHQRRVKKKKKNRNKSIFNFYIMNWVKELKIKHFDGVLNKDSRQWAYNCEIINLDSNNGPGTHWVVMLTLFILIPLDYHHPRHLCKKVIPKKLWVDAIEDFPKVSVLHLLGKPEQWREARLAADKEIKRLTPRAKRNEQKNNAGEPIMKEEEGVFNRRHTLGPYTTNIKALEASQVVIWEGNKKIREQDSKQSKKISNDQELIQSDPTSCPQNQKRNN